MERCKIIVTRTGFDFFGGEKSQNTALCLSGADEYPIFLDSVTENGNLFVAEYTVKDYDKVKIFSEIETISGTPVYKQRTRLENDGENRFDFAKLDSAVVENVCLSERKMRDRVADGSVNIYYALSGWQKEGQWRKVTPETVGLALTSGHDFERRTFRLESVSSLSTGSYFPMLLIEDKDEKKTYFFEVTGGHSWYIELSLQGYDAESFVVKTGVADEKTGFYGRMEREKSFTTNYTLFGSVEGGFENAVKALIKYKRKEAPLKKVNPIVFNDYMNCNWAIETPERLIKLIDRAAELGAEVFCIDDGWQKKLGEWYPDDEKFAGYGLKGIIDYIKSKGMIAGVWFEFESLPLSAIKTLGNDALLTRNGKIIAEHRPLADFRCEKVVGYLYERVDELVNLGVGFIKNDHNNAEYIGTDSRGESPAEGLMQNAAAFNAFIDGIRKKYPDIIIENCASGGTRQDHETLKRFDLQSISDQEDYLKFPSIIVGNSALVPPEKAGVWCYPYPLKFEDRENNDITEREKTEYRDGEQTIFNAVNAAMGLPYLSGRIENIDEINLKLYKEAVILFKELRAFVSNSYPIYPLGFLGICEKRAFSFGYADEDKNEIILAAWNLTDNAVTHKCDIDGNYDAEIIYPRGAKEKVFFSHGTLTVEFSKGETARLIKLVKKR